MFNKYLETEPRLCPHCLKERLQYPEEIRSNACFSCAYNLPATPIEEEILATKIHRTVSRVIVPAKIHAQLQTYCNLAPGEISGFGKIKLVDDVATVVGVALLPQQNTAANTVITSAALNKFTYNLIKNNQPLEDWKVWWHTHHDFSTFWSAQDESNISLLCKSFKTWIISLELNQAGNMIARVDEKRSRFDLELAIKSFKGYARMGTKCQKQISKMCKSPRVVLPRYYKPIAGYSYYDY